MGSLGREILSFLSQENQQRVCRVCHFASPLLWMFGSLYLSLLALNIHGEFAGTTYTWPVTFLALFLIVCALFTCSNFLHVCMQIPTSGQAAKLQVRAQCIMLIFLAFILGINFYVYLQVEDNSEYLKIYWNLLIQSSLMCAAKTCTSVGCLLG
mmetsp:Transcript_11951/g.17458  ORF Transcript_11951/g.17458 Transcript_11951/m.17458 type:complete len:154 (+) Transcript_11951:73-534(+)